MLADTWTHPERLGQVDPSWRSCSRTRGCWSQRWTLVTICMTWSTWTELNQEPSLTISSQDTFFGFPITEKARTDLWVSLELSSSSALRKYLTEPAQPSKDVGRSRVGRTNRKSNSCRPSGNLCRAPEPMPPIRTLKRRDWGNAQDLLTPMSSCLIGLAKFKSFTPMSAALNPCYNKGKDKFLLFEIFCNFISII